MSMLRNTQPAGHTDPGDSPDMDSPEILAKLRDWADDRATLSDWLSETDYCAKEAANSIARIVTETRDDEFGPATDLRKLVRAAYLADDDNAMEAYEAVIEQGRYEAEEAAADSRGDDW